MFPTCNIAASLRAQGHKGGIVTVVTLPWTIAAQATCKYFVGTRVVHGSIILVVVNVYIPPITSSYGPKRSEDYEQSLREIQEWVQKQYLEIKGITATLWMGDFNARMGKVVLQEAADHQDNKRGQILANIMPEWGYELCKVHSDMCEGPAPFTCVNITGNAYTTIDYVWTYTPKHTKMQVRAFTGHWIDRPRPSCHAALVVEVPIPLMPHQHVNATSAQAVIHQPLRLQLAGQQLEQFRESEWGRLEQLASLVMGSNIAAHNVQSAFEEIVRQRLGEVLGDPGITMTRSRTAVVRNPNQQTKVRRPWYNATCHTARAQLHRVLKQYGHAAEATREQRRIYRGVLRNAHRQYLHSLEGLRLSKPGDFWRLLKKPVEQIKVDPSVLHQHYKGLLATVPEGYHSEMLMGAAPGGEPYSAAEVEEAVRKLHNNKSLGNQWLSAELLKHHSKASFYHALAALINSAFTSGFPKPWNTLSIRSLFKKGDMADPANYRGLSVMGVLPKLAAQVLLARLEAHTIANSLRAHNQAGFRAGARIEDNAILLQIALEKAKVAKEHLYVMFVDLEKAYDSIDRGKLWGVLLEELHLPTPLVAGLQRLYEHLTAQVADAPGTSSIPIKVGLKQGCPCSPLLFSLYFDRVEEAVEKVTKMVYGRQQGAFVKLLTLQLVILLFADDVVLLARTLEGLGHLFESFSTFCSSNHLRISRAKTQVMVVRDDNTDMVSFGSWQFKCVQEFKYLGLVFNKTASDVHMITHRLAAARGAFVKLCEFLGVQQWSCPWTRLLMHDTFVRTQLTFGAALWAPKALRGGLALGGSRRTVLSPLTAHYQSGLRTMLALPVDTRLEVLYAVSLRLPLQVLVAKATWRYYRRMTMLSREQQCPPIGVVAKWAELIEDKQYTVHAGLELAAKVDKAERFYFDAISYVREGIGNSSRLDHPVLQHIWQGIVQLGIGGGCGSVQGRLWPLQGISFPDLKRAMPGSFMQMGSDGQNAHLLNRPSWLMSTTKELSRFMEIFYNTPTWAQQNIADNKVRGWFVKECAEWKQSHVVMHQFIQANGIVTSLWVNAKLICDMIELSSQH